MQTSSEFRKPSAPQKPKHPKHIISQQCAPIGCTRQEVGSLYLLATTYIYSNINTHNTKLQMIKVHINNTKHIPITNIYIYIYIYIYIPPRDNTLQTS